MPATHASPDTTGEPVTAPPAATAKLRFAVKTALALTLAYLTPMALGWPQPQTAAITVMLIAATGALSASLHKGLMRIVGTLAGALIGLTLIALFPQDRFLYLLSVSVLVAVIFYLYNAYRGDGTIFMLTAMIIMMVFNGGNAEGAFTYGVDRTLLTVFGVITYTLVASLLWPVREEHDLQRTANTLTGKFHRAFKRLTLADQENDTQQFLQELLSAKDSFRQDLVAALADDNRVADYRSEWKVVDACFQDLGDLLVPALQHQDDTGRNANELPDTSRPAIARCEELFRHCEQKWEGADTTTPATTIIADGDWQTYANMTHMQIAAVVTGNRRLRQLQEILSDLACAQDRLLFDSDCALPLRATRKPPAFAAFDLEHLKTALRAFTTFWLACAVWIFFNPPGGFMFVTLCTALIPLVSFTPVSPKLLIILFSLGFLFALPAYVFLLPHMTHWLQLAIFLFTYALLGFFILPGPVTIFFLMGLFTLGIQNEMSYHVDVILLVILMMYMVCAMQIVAINFPFTSKPQRLYPDIQRRFFQRCERCLRRILATREPTTHWGGDILVNKLGQWGSQIDETYYPGAPQSSIVALNRNCELVQAQLHALSAHLSQNPDNSLSNRLLTPAHIQPLADFCELLADPQAAPAARSAALASLRADLARVRDPLESTPRKDLREEHDVAELAELYVLLNMLSSLSRLLSQCADAQDEVDWTQLQESRF